MKRVTTLLLWTCLLVLAGIPVVAQEDLSVAQKRDEAAKAAAQEKRAAARAAAAQLRSAARANVQEKRAAAREIRGARARMERALAEAAKKQRLEGTFKFLGSRPGIDLRSVVIGAPYSATAITEHTQTLSDGNQIMQRNEATYYRDSEGRLRVDQTLKTIGKWTAEGDPPRIITIWDPVAGHYYSLDPRTRTALKDPKGRLKLRTVEREKLKAERAEKQLKELKTRLTGLEKTKEKQLDLVPKVKVAPVQKSSDSRRKKEELGKQTIEGVAAEGTRSTFTIPAGEIGNLLPIEIVDEAWYSTELQVLVLTKHHDPRSGDTVYRLTNLNRSEPDGSLFEVPADYRVVDRSAPKPPATKLENEE